MKIKTLLIAALILSAYACSPRGDGTVSIVDVNGTEVFVMSLGNLRSDVATIPLSSLVESLEMVQLEDHDDAFFTSRAITTVTENYIGIREERRSYLLFSRSGQFLGNIGSVGQGPGEFISLRDEFIDDKNGLIYLADITRDRVLVYNTSGEFVREIVTPVRLNKPRIFVSDNVLSIFHLSFGENSPMAFQIDINTGQPLSQIGTPAHFVVHSFDSEIFNTRNVEGVFDFTHTSVDTMFHFDMENNRIRPVFTMTGTEGTWRNNFQINRDLIMTYVNVFDDNIRRWVLRGIVATDLRNLTSSYVNIVNDFFGNLPVAAMGTFRNGYFVWNVQPEDLMYQIENHLDRGNVSQSDRQQLENLLSRLEEDTNNVVFIGRLRDGIEGRLW